MRTNWRHKRLSWEGEMDSLRWVVRKIMWRIFHIIKS